MVKKGPHIKFVPIEEKTWKIKIKNWPKSRHLFIYLFFLTIVDHHPTDVLGGSSYCNDWGWNVTKTKKRKSVIYVAATNYCCSNKNVTWCSTRADATAVTGSCQNTCDIDYCWNLCRCYTSNIKNWNQGKIKTTDKLLRQLKFLITITTLPITYCALEHWASLDRLTCPQHWTSWRQWRAAVAPQSSDPPQNGTFRL